MNVDIWSQQIKRKSVLSSLWDSSIEKGPLDNKYHELDILKYMYQSQKTRTNFLDFSQRVATEKKPHFKEIVKSVLL